MSDLNINNLGVLNKLGSYINTVSEVSSEYVISSYLIRNINRINNIGVYDIVEDCYVSISAVRRFCNDIGYNNFSDLKSSLNDVIYPSNIHQRSFTNIDFYRRVLEQELINKLDTVNKLLDDKTVINLCQLIESYDNVYFLCANNTSGNIIRFQQELFSVNKITHIISSNFELEFANRIHSSNRSLIIVVSVSGLFADSINNIISSSNNHYKLLVTSNSKEKFVKEYNKIVNLSDEPIDDDNYGIISKYGVTLFFDLLSEQYIYMSRNKI